MLIASFSSILKGANQPVSDSQSNQYTPAEEVAHAATHGLGALLSIGALIWMLEISIAASDHWRLVSSAVYGLSLILLFGASTLYHTFHSSSKKHLLKLLDHCAIYVLIAGTATPFLLVAMQTNLRWWLFAAMWSMAVVGIVGKLKFGSRHPRLSLFSYLLMGWLMVIAVPDLLAVLGSTGVQWIVAGGISYSVGAGFYMAKSMKFSHTIWHVFVLGGAACHFFAVIWHVLPAENLN
jgi:hemolysin III